MAKTLAKAPLVYFIGGAPHSGKAELADLFLKQLAETGQRLPQYIGTNAVRRILWSNVAETEEPAFFQMHSDRATWTEARWLEQAQGDPFYFVDRQHAESEVVWRRGVLHVLACNTDRETSTLVGGVAVLPQLLAGYKEPHKAVFIGNNQPPSPEYMANVRRRAQHIRDHWLTQWSQAKIEAYFTQLVPAYSQRLQELAETHGYAYFDLSTGNHQAALEQAASYLAN